MAEYRTVRMSFWHDPFIEELDASQKLLFMYLFTCPYTNNLGVVEATRKKISYETGLSVQDVNKAVQYFVSKGKLFTDEQNNLILIKNFIKHQTSTSPKIIDGLKKLIVAVSSKLILSELYRIYPSYFNGLGLEIDGIHTLCEGQDTICIPSAEFGSLNLEREEELKLNVQIIPQKPLRKKDNTNVDPDFELFWQAYPKKKSKQDAVRAWVKNKKYMPDMQVLLTSLNIQSESKDWIKDDGEYIPFPATWLNKHRWDDVDTKAQQQNQRPEWMKGLGEVI